MKDDGEISRWVDGTWVPIDKDRDKAEELAPVPIDRGVVGAAIDCGELEQALGLGKAHADAEFDIVHGGRVTSLEAQAVFLRARLDVEQAELDRNERALAREPLQIPASKQNGGADSPGDETEEVPPRRWQLRDQLSAGGAALGIVGLSAASYFGVEATFANAQLPIFDDNPHLTYALAAIAPTAGLAVKTAGKVFTDPDNRDRYNKLVVIAGIGAFALWVPMFGGLFEGLSGVFDPFAEPNHLLGWAFNVGHIIAEVFIAAGLSVHLDATMLKYAPSEQVDNQARPPLERAKAKQVSVVEGLTARLGDVEGPLSRLYGLRERARILVEAAIRQRMNEKPRDGLL
ncbi:MAG: hypothetical protein AAGE90_16240 [Pseudomonadota bacterium]